MRYFDNKNCNQTLRYFDNKNCNQTLRYFDKMFFSYLNPTSSLKVFIADLEQIGLLRSLDSTSSLVVTWVVSLLEDAKKHTTKLSWGEQRFCRFFDKFVVVWLVATKFRIVKLEKEICRYFYSRKQAEGENLRPTLDALRKHFKRAHYIAMIYARNFRNIHNLPSTEEYGWKYDSINEFYEPDMMRNLPAPIAVINFVTF